QDLQLGVVGVRHGGFSGKKIFNKFEVFLVSALFASRLCCAAHVLNYSDQPATGSGLSLS
ncbi:hypothetical protein, partial [Cupriavidus sp.]|uniref:hypothetical protein n=1 Tax=Cupriavidus sp. TaxID=1873897 RepID=UPI0028BE4E9B